MTADYFSSRKIPSSGKLVGASKRAPSTYTFQRLSRRIPVSKVSKSIKCGESLSLTLATVHATKFNDDTSEEDLTRKCQR